MENVTVSDLIKLLDKEGNRRGGATGKSGYYLYKLMESSLDISHL